MSDGPSSEREIAPDNLLQRSAAGDVRGGTESHVVFEAAFQKILEAVEQKNDGKVILIIREHGVAELQGAAGTGSLSNVGQPGLRKVVYHAVENGNEDLLKIVLAERTVDVNAVLGRSRVEEGDPRNGCTALILACWKGHIEIVRMLLQKGANVHIYTRDGLTCLHMAAFSGHIEVVNVLLHGKAKRKRWEEGDTGFMGNLALSRSRWALIEKKTEIEEFTALHMAAGGSQDQKAKRIVESILEALMVSVLVFYKVATNPGEVFETERALWHNFLIQVRNELHRHLVGGEICQEGILQNLAAYGNRNSGLLLQERLQKKRQSEKNEGSVYERFVRAFVELISYCNARDVMGRTALHHAAWERRAELVKLFMWDSQFGSIANVNIADVGGHTALHLASWIGCEDVVKELMSCNTAAPGRRKAAPEETGTVRRKITLKTQKKTEAEPSSTEDSDASRKDAKVARPEETKPSSGKDDEASTKDAKLARPEETEPTSAEKREESREDAELGWPEETQPSSPFLPLDDLFAGKSFLQPNAATTNPTGRSAEIVIVAINRDAKKLEEKLVHDQSGRSLLFKEEKKVFYYYLEGKNVWFENRAGVTPLHYAVEHHHDGVVVLLMMHPKTDMFWCASDGQSPWTIAFPLDREALIEEDVRNPTLTQLRLRGDRRKKLRQSKRSTFEHSFKMSWKNYFYSRKFHQQQLLKRTIELARADENDSDSKVELRNLETQIIITFASNLTRLYGSENIALKLNQWNIRNLTLLQAAAFYGLEEEIEALLAFKTYRDHVNGRETFTKAGRTALHCAAHGGVDAMAALLKEKTLDLSQQNIQCPTPMKGLRINIEVIEMIEKLTTGVCPNFCLKSWGILPEVAKQRFQEILRILMENPLVVERLYRDRQVFVDAANAILVGAALIASVTFGGFLQPPLGYVLFNAEQSSRTPESFAAVEQHVSVRVFWAFNSLSFFTAIATVVAGGGAVLPASEKSIDDEVRMVKKWLRGTSALLAISILCVLGAFSAAGFASLPNVFKYEMNIIATATTGLVLCVIVLCLFFYRLYLSFNSTSPVRIVVLQTVTWIAFFTKALFVIPLYFVMAVVLAIVVAVVLLALVLAKQVEIRTGFSFNISYLSWESSRKYTDSVAQFAKNRLGRASRILLAPVLRENLGSFFI